MPNFLTPPTGETQWRDPAQLTPHGAFADTMTNFVRDFLMKKPSTTGGGAENTFETLINLLTLKAMPPAPGRMPRPVPRAGIVQFPLQKNPSLLFEPFDLRVLRGILERAGHDAGPLGGAAGPVSGWYPPTTGIQQGFSSSENYGTFMKNMLKNLSRYRGSITPSDQNLLGRNLPPTTAPQGNPTPKTAIYKLISELSAPWVMPPE